MRPFLFQTYNLYPRMRHKNPSNPQEIKQSKNSFWRYDFTSSSRLRELSPKTTGEKMHDLNETQKKLKPQGYVVKPSRVVRRASYHVTVQVDSNSKFLEDEPGEASQVFEDRGQAIVDELKELNLGTNENPRPIYVSVLLSPFEEKSYFELLLNYKDVFTWSYKEMPGLDPKVAVHQLMVKHGVRPIKQAQR
ncbi:hypothetical protein AAG906_015998 [Vitis piasezkii]